MIFLRATAMVLVAAGVGIGTASASELRYTPINPSFGGNPFNGTFLLDVAREQRPTADSSGGSTDGGASLAELLGAESSDGTSDTTGLLTDGRLITVDERTGGLVLDVFDVTR